MSPSGKPLGLSLYLQCSLYVALYPALVDEYAEYTIMHTEKRSSQAVAIPVLFRAGPGWLRLLLRNAALNLITAGFYRFWARTVQRRYLWAATEIDGEAFEYEGLGREPFLGFLIAMAMLLPLTILYSGLQVWLASDGFKANVLWLVYIAAVVILSSAAAYQGRRYRLSRSVWRGIRMAQDGSTQTYTGSYALWTVVFVLSAGLSVPWACADLARYRIGHTLWGDRRGRFDGKAADLRDHWFWAWIGIALASAAYFHLGAADEETDAWVTVGYFCVSAAAIATCYLYFLARWFRWYVEGIWFGPLRLRCTLGPGLWLRTLLPAVLALAIYAVLSGIAGTFVYYYADEIWPLLGLPPNFADPTLTAALFALPILAGWGVVYRAWLLLPAIRLMLNSILLLNFHTAAGTVQNRIDTSRSGEGFADSFDVGIG